MLDQIILAPLKGEKQAKVESYKEVTNEKGGYVEVNLQLDDRIYPYIIFPGKESTKDRQLNYFVSCLRNQWNLDQAMSLKEVLEYGKTHEFSVYFSYNTLYNRMNVEFHEAQPEISLSDIEGA